MRHPEATSCLCKCETPRVKMIRPWVRCAPEGICLACILFGLFLPYGLINNARRLQTQLQWWRHQNAKRDCALSCPMKTGGLCRLLISGLCIAASRSRLVRSLDRLLARLLAPLSSRPQKLEMWPFESRAVWCRWRTRWRDKLGRSGKWLVSTGGNYCCRCSELSASEMRCAFVKKIK